MEEAIKSRVDILVQKIKTAEIIEKELHLQIEFNKKQNILEEQHVMELHQKLQQVECALQKKENKNLELMQYMRKKEYEQEAIEEYQRREQPEEESEKTRWERERYGDWIIEANKLKPRYSDLDVRIAEIEEQLREEAKICNEEEKKVRVLTEEMIAVEKRLNDMRQNENVLAKQEAEQSTKIADLKAKQRESELQTNLLQNEVTKMERILEETTCSLSALHDGHEKISHQISKEKEKITAPIASQTFLHKAYKIRKNGNNVIAQDAC